MYIQDLAVTMLIITNFKLYQPITSLYLLIIKNEQKFFLKATPFRKGGLKIQTLQFNIIETNHLGVMIAKRSLSTLIPPKIFSVKVC